jgi:hypothetical protein
MGKAHRDGETVLITVRIQEHCPICDERTWEHILIVVPCDVIRSEDAIGVRSFVYSKVKDFIFAFGPISFQKLMEAIMEGLARFDLKALAGEPLLINMETKGRA